MSTATAGAATSCGAPCGNGYSEYREPRRQTEPARRGHTCRLAPARATADADETATAPWRPDPVHARPGPPRCGNIQAEALGDPTTESPDSWGTPSDIPEEILREKTPATQSTAPSLRNSAPARQECSHQHPLIPRRSPATLSSSTTPSRRESYRAPKPEEAHSIKKTQLPAAAKRIGRPNPRIPVVYNLLARLRPSPANPANA